MTSDPMQLIKEVLPAIDLAIDQAMERDTTAENIQASYALKSIRAALQALTAASGTEREGVDLEALKAEYHEKYADTSLEAAVISHVLDDLASRSLIQPIPAKAEKDGGEVDAMPPRAEILAERLRSGIEELTEKIPRKAYDDVGALKISLLTDVEEIEERLTTPSPPPDALGKALRSDAAVAMGYAPNYLGKIVTISANNLKSNSFAERYDLAALGKILLNHLNRTATAGGQT